MALSPQWESDSELDELVAAVAVASDCGASTLLLGDRPARGRGARSNSVLMAAMIPELSPIPKVGALFLTRESPLQHFVASISTLSELIARSGATPVIGLMHGRSTVMRDAPSIEDVVGALRWEARIGRFELWIAAERGIALERAGRLADTWLANGHHGPAALNRQLQTLAEMGTYPKAAIRRDFVCDTQGRRAHATARQLLSEGYRDGRFEESALIAGDPDECLERMADVARLGFDDVLVRPALRGPKGLDQFRLLFGRWRELRGELATRGRSATPSTNE